MIKEMEYIETDATYEVVDGKTRKKVGNIYNVDTASDIMNIDIEENSIIKTNGYYSVGDKGNAYYIVKSVESELPYLKTKNGFFAELIICDSMNIKSFGVKENGVDDDSKLIEVALNLVKKLKFNEKVYGIKNIINIQTNSPILEISGKGELKCLKDGNEYCIINNKSDLEIRDIFFNQNLKGRKALYLKNSNNVKVKNCKISGYTAEFGWSTFENCIFIDSANNIEIDSCYFYKNGDQYQASQSGKLNRCIGTSKNTDISDIIITNCKFDKVNQAIVIDSNNVIISNCIFTNVNDNILYSFGGNVMFLNNLCYNAKDEGLVVGSGSENNNYSDYVICNNIFDNIVNTPIVLNGKIGNINISGNELKAKQSNQLIKSRSGTNIKTLILNNNVLLNKNDSINGMSIGILEAINMLVLSNNFIDFNGNASSTTSTRVLQLNANIQNVTIIGNTITSKNGCDMFSNQANIKQGIFSNNNVNKVRFGFLNMKNVPNGRTDIGPYFTGNSLLFFGNTKPKGTNYNIGDIVINNSSQNNNILGWKCTAKTSTETTWVELKITN